jgi:hypothetical protein
MTASSAKDETVEPKPTEIANRSPSCNHKQQAARRTKERAWELLLKGSEDARAPIANAQAAVFFFGGDCDWPTPTTPR